MVAKQNEKVNHLNHVEVTMARKGQIGKGVGKGSSRLRASSHGIDRKLMGHKMKVQVII